MLDLYKAIYVLMNYRAMPPDILSYASDSKWWIDSLEQLMDGRSKTKAEQEFFKLIKDENIFYHFFAEKDPVGYCLELLKKLKIDDFENDFVQLVFAACKATCYFHVPLRKDYRPLELGFDLTEDEIEIFKAGCEEGLKVYFKKKDYSKAFSLFQSNPLNPLSQFFMAHIYENGLNDIKVDSIKARKLYEESADKEFVPAIAKKAKFYFLGIGGELKRKLGLELYDEVMKKGNPASFFDLCEFYNFIGKKKEVYRLSKEGVEHNSYRCYFYLIQSNHQNDMKKDIKILKEGVSKGDPLCILAYLKTSNSKLESVLKRLNKMLSTNLTSHERGMYEIFASDICLDLYKDSKDSKYHELIKYYLEEAMKDKNKDSFVLYADNFLKGKEANEVYLQGAYCDDRECCEMMAENYLEGINIEQDYGRAAFWAEGAIQLDSFDGVVVKCQLMLLGKCYKRDIKTATRVLKLLSDEGCNSATYLLGNLYLKKALPGGNSKAFKYFERGYLNCFEPCAFEYAKMNVRKMVKNADSKKGYEILQKLADAGDGFAQMELAVCLIFGRFLAKDESLGLKYFEMAQKNTKNQLVQKSVETLLGLSYYYGREGFEQDDDKALEHLKKAYDLGEHYICEELGTLYLIKDDFKNAKFYYEEGAKLGISDCLLGLGQIYFEGYGLPKDLKKAEEYFKKAVLCGVNEAYYWLARVYMEFDLKKTDGKRILSLLREACKHKVPEALNNLGYQYQEGPYIKRHDMKKAISLYKEASEYGLSSAQFNLGSYLLSQSDPKLHEEGFQWMYQLAKKGDAYAMLTLIGCYIFSDDEDKKDLAFEWIEKADKLLPNHPFINFYYGYCYMFGYGVIEDQKKAVEYLKKSAYLDDPFSCFLLGQSYRYATEFPHDPDLYFLWVKKAYEINPNASISTELGKAYEEGYGTRQDFVKAKECFLNGLKMGSITSYDHLKRLYGGKLPKRIQDIWDKIPQEEKVDDKVGIDAIDVFEKKEKED